MFTHLEQARRGSSSSSGGSGNGSPAYPPACQRPRRNTHQLTPAPSAARAPALILNRSSRVMPGLRGTPAGMMTTCAPLSASPSWSSPGRRRGVVEGWAGRPGSAPRQVATPAPQRGHQPHRPDAWRPPRCRPRLHCVRATQVHTRTRTRARSQHSKQGSRCKLCQSARDAGQPSQAAHPRSP